MSYDEHGPVEEPEREYGPEWWAMGNELCKCGHRADLHHEVIDWHGNDPARWECGSLDCFCGDYIPALDK